jgi:hypothetical protein
MNKQQSSQTGMRIAFVPWEYVLESAFQQLAPDD